MHLLLNIPSSPCWYYLLVLGLLSSNLFLQVSTHPSCKYCIYILLKAIQLAVDEINNSTDILPNTKISVEPFYHFGSAAVAVKRMLEFADEGVSFVIGNYFVDVVSFSASVGKVFDIAQLSPSVSSPLLSNERDYPFFSRLASPSTIQAKVIRETLRHAASIRGSRGWDEIAILSTTDPYGVGLAQDFIATIEDTDDIRVATYQQFIFVGELDGTKTDITVELREIKDSGARVICALVVGGYEDVIIDANEVGLVGEEFVWIVGDAISGVFFYNPEAIELSRGLLGTFQYLPEDTPQTRAFENLWNSADPNIYIGAGGPMSPYYPLTYDMMYASAHLLEVMDDKGLLDSGERISGAVWTEELRKLEFEGVTGHIQFDEVGDRKQAAAGSFYNPDSQTWKEYAFFDENEGYNIIRDIVWFSNSTDIPDLDIREPFHYWSCEDGERKFDATGKSVTLHTPDGSDIDDIDSGYHCDNFIDCENLSDESVDCSSNYTALFITFGIITSCLILIACALLVFTILFGVFLKYQKLRAISPTFLVIMLLSIIIGYFSVFAWFGKPHPVACAFQPWLLGLPVLSMVTALCLKSYRVWRIFRSELRKRKITDLSLLVIWCFVMVPAIVIIVIWMIVSTPTAAIQERDGADHFVCATGGFTGEPGGYIFFGVFVAYSAIILMGGVFFSVVTRNVPSLFNESKLLAISIYNLGLLSVLIIPTFLVIQQYNPFIAWILRTCAILYAFTATMVLQFAAPIISIVFVDRLKNKTGYINISSSTSKTTEQGK